MKSYKRYCKKCKSKTKHIEKYEKLTNIETIIFLGMNHLFDTSRKYRICRKCGKTKQIAGV